MVMKTLLSDLYAPITSSAGFLKANLDNSGEALLQWRKSIGSKIEKQARKEGFPLVLNQLEPLTTHSVTKELLINTRSEWVAYFNNNHLGSDVFGPIGVLSEMLKCSGVTVQCIPNTYRKSEKNKGRFGAIQLTMFSGNRRDGFDIVRGISVINDGGRWTFDTIGDIQPFENYEHYKSKRLPDRFTSEMLEAYCHAIGIEYFDPSFYQDQSVLFKLKDRLPRDARCYSLKEVQQSL
jgi:hypothetical protein